MFRSSYRIATVWGIPIKLHISHILLFLFLIPDFGFLSGILIGVGLFTSIALHELGHSIVAINKGCQVREILLMPIGGAAQMDRIPTRPRDEFLMAIAGPAVSLALGVGGFLAGEKLLCMGLDISKDLAWFEAVELSHVLLSKEFKGVVTYAGMIITHLALVNCVLVVFNLMPSFPMDGGRVLRALLTPKLGRLRATFIAARLGKMLAILAGAFGVINGIWTLVAIAFFIHIAAGKEYQLVEMQERARRAQGFGGFTPPQNWWSDGIDDDQVTISPPPYETGPDSKADLHSNEQDNNPFRP